MVVYVGTSSKIAKPASVSLLEPPSSSSATSSASLPRFLRPLAEVSSTSGVSYAG